MKSISSINTPKRGRPTGSGQFDTRLPEVRVTQENLVIYRKMAIKSGLSFSNWMRETLDKAIEKSAR